MNSINRHKEVSKYKWKSIIIVLVHIRGIGFSDLTDLWVTKIKKPVILCMDSTLRSSEQSMKRRSCRESM